MRKVFWPQRGMPVIKGRRPLDLEGHFLNSSDSPARWASMQANLTTGFAMHLACGDILRVSLPGVARVQGKLRRSVDFWSHELHASEFV